MARTFAIEAADESSTLLFTSALGDKSVVIFSAHEKAAQFVAQQADKSASKVVELHSDSIHAWTEKIRNYGVHHAILGPPADGDLTKVGHTTLDVLVAAAGI
jgi:hypothetical protein